jgi:hypothetical protein
MTPLSPTNNNLKYTTILMPLTPVELLRPCRRLKKRRTTTTEEWEGCKWVEWECSNDSLCVFPPTSLSVSISLSPLNEQETYQRRRCAFAPTASIPPLSPPPLCQPSQPPLRPPIKHLFPPSHRRKRPPLSNNLLLPPSLSPHLSHAKIRGYPSRCDSDARDGVAGRGRGLHRVVVVG